MYVYVGSIVGGFVWVCKVWNHCLFGSPRRLTIIRRSPFNCRVLYPPRLIPFSLYPFLYIWGGGSLGLLLEGQGACARVIFVLRECIWNAPAISLVLPTFDDSGSLGSHPRQGVYHPGFLVPPWVTASRFLWENRETELKPIFSSLLLFHDFLSFSSPDL